jgi:hypothetical protein
MIRRNRRRGRPDTPSRSPRSLRRARPLRRSGIGNRLSPLNNIRNKPRPAIRRPGPGIAPPNVPGVMGSNAGPGGGFGSPSRPRRPGSGGSRTMRRPTMGNVIKGPRKRRGY